MADAKKCDRCGVFYKSLGYPKVDVMICNRPYAGFYYDLCPTCHEELKKWLKIERNKDYFKYLEVKNDE